MLFDEQPGTFLIYISYLMKMHTSPFKCNSMDVSRCQFKMSTLT